MCTTSIGTGRRHPRQRVPSGNRVRIQCHLASSCACLHCPQYLCPCRGLKQQEGLPNVTNVQDAREECDPTFKLPSHSVFYNTLGSTSPVKRFPFSSATQLLDVNNLSRSPKKVLSDCSFQRTFHPSFAERIYKYYLGLHVLSPSSLINQDQEPPVPPRLYKARL